MKNLERLVLLFFSVGLFLFSIHSVNVGSIVEESVKTSIEVDLMVEKVILGFESGELPIIGNEDKIIYALQTSNDSERSTREVFNKAGSALSGWGIIIGIISLLQIIILIYFYVRDKKQA